MRQDPKPRSVFLDQLMAALDEAEQHGIHDLVWDAIMPVETIEGVVALSKKLLEQVSRQRRSKRAGETHLVRDKGHYSSTFINFLIVGMLGLCNFRQFAPPKELFQLARFHLETDKYATKRIGDDRRDNALDMLVVFPEIRQSEIAKTLRVSAARVSQWFSDEQFLRDLEIRKKDPSETVSFALYLAAQPAHAPAKDEDEFISMYKFIGLIKHLDSHELLEKIHRHGLEQVALAILDANDTANAKTEN